MDSEGTQKLLFLSLLYFQIEVGRAPVAGSRATYPKYRACSKKSFLAPHHNNHYKMIALLENPVIWGWSPGIFGPGTGPLSKLEQSLLQPTMPAESS